MPIRLLPSWFANFERHPLLQGMNRSACMPLCASCVEAYLAGKATSESGSSGGPVPHCRLRSLAKCIRGPAVDISAPWRDRAQGNTVSRCCAFQWPAFRSLAWVLRQVGLGSAQRRSVACTLDNGICSPRPDTGTMGRSKALVPASNLMVLLPVPG